MSALALPELLGPILAGDLTLPMAATRIFAGLPSPADDFMDDELDIQRFIALNRQATFLWRVIGTSMIEIGIHDGDRRGQPQRRTRER